MREEPPHVVALSGTRTDDQEAIISERGKREITDDLAILF